LFKVINDQLYRLLAGGGFSAAVYLTIIGALLVTGGMFALMTIERKREFGLLKAMGARNSFIFKLVITEAALLGSAGAALGIGIAAVCLLLVHVGIIFQEIAFALPSAAMALRAMLVTAALTVGIATTMALYPALAAGRLDPYTAIRSGE
jgi:putative ABC transport system permease protein